MAEKFQQYERFAGPNNDIKRPDYVEIPPALEREMPIRVAVIAEGAVTPIGNTAEETWKNYKAGMSGIVQNLYPPYTDRPTKEQREAGIVPQIEATTAGTIKNFDPIELIANRGLLPRKEVVFRLDPYAQYSLVASFEALSKVVDEDGRRLLIPRLNPDGTLDKNRQWTINEELVDLLYITASIASGFGGGDVSAEVMALLMDGKVPDGDHMQRSLLDRAVTPVTQMARILGGAQGHVAACASTGKAWLTGMYKISVGDADVAVVGGTEGVLGTPIATAEFDTQGALDSGEDPLQVSRALHKIRGGFTIAGGCVVHVIANPEWARKHGIRILYEIVGYGDTSGAGDNTAPNGPAQEMAMRIARRRAERQGRIEGKVINSGHYTGTELGDHSEVLHTQNVLEDLQDRSTIVATKRLVGHMLGAAGGMSQLIAGKAIQEGIAPGTPFTGEKMDELYGWDVPEETRPEPDITDAVVNQFGFGDANVTLWSRRVR